MSTNPTVADTASASAPAMHAAHAAGAMAEVVHAAREALCDALGAADPFAMAIREDVPPFVLTPRMVGAAETDRRAYRPGLPRPDGLRRFEVTQTDPASVALAVAMACTDLIPAPVFRAGGGEKAVTAARRALRTRMAGGAKGVGSTLSDFAKVALGVQTSPVGRAVRAAEEAADGRWLGDGGAEPTPLGGGQWGLAWMDDQGRPRFTPLFGTHLLSDPDRGALYEVILRRVDDGMTRTLVAGKVARRTPQRGAPAKVETE